MADAVQAALSAAGRSLAVTMRLVAARYTKRGAAAVNVHRLGRGAIGVRAGTPVGPWGWTPINAYELDDNARHPFFGDRRRWYSENDKKHAGETGLITENTVDAGADQAARAFADAFMNEIFG